MTTSLPSNAKDIMAENLGILAKYARRVILEGDTLSQREDEDRSARLWEIFGIGSSFGCTNKDLVALLYRGLFVVKRR